MNKEKLTEIINDFLKDSENKSALVDEKETNKHENTKYEM